MPKKLKDAKDEKLVADVKTAPDGGRSKLPVEAQDALVDTGRWIGGQLVNYWSMNTHPIVRGADGQPIKDPEFPIKTTIRYVQFVDGYFEVIGDDFACNGLAGQLKSMSSTSRFPKETEDTLVLWGGGKHEWHIVPKG